MLDLSRLLAVIKTVAPLVLPGSAQALAAGEALLDLVRSVRPTLSASDQAALDAALPDLLAKMNRDVDQAIADLRG